MTPIRAKRASKAPNRFSSDNSQIDISSSAGETIIDYNDNSTSTTHNILPMNRAIKLKPALREPLKVKLPKLKRSSSQIVSSEKSLNRSKNSDVLIHKIKLPSLSSKKSSETSKTSDSRRGIKQNSYNKIKQTSKLNDSSKNSTRDSFTNPINSMNHDQICANNNVQNRAIVGTVTNNNGSNLSTSSISSEQDKSANVSLSSDDGQETSSRMEIVVSQPGNVSSNGIRCPCGVDDDLGVMVECESCSTWQHGHCINVGSEEDAYEGYICAFCCMPRDKVRESLCQLTVGDKFQSHFQRLESLGRNPGSSTDIDCDLDRREVIENCAHLSIKELASALNDARRVLNSLRAKLRLLASPSYESELRIWQNPWWSEKSSRNNEDDNNFYFLDRSRQNLRSNIQNMIDKLEKRCHIIKYSLSSCTKSDEFPPNLGLNNLKDIIDEVIMALTDIRTKFENLPK